MLTEETTHIRELAVALDERAIDRLMEAVGDARYVRLGEASHGTSEYYRWRAEISKRLHSFHGSDRRHDP